MKLNVMFFSNLLLLNSGEHVCVRTVLVTVR
jgi:hypothetical protein